MELCGEGAMSNVVLVSTRYRRTLSSMGSELQTLTKEYFKPALEMGAKASFIGLFRGEDPTLKMFSTKRPVVLKIQRELIDEGRDFRQTTAGTELKRKMGELITMRNERIAQLKVSTREEKTFSGYLELESGMRLEEKEVQRLERGIAQMDSAPGEDSHEKDRDSVEEYIRMIRELEEGKQKAMRKVKGLRRELEEQERRTKEANVLSKENTAKMARYMEKMDREAKELRQALEEQRRRAREEADGFRKRIANMQSEFEEERNRSGESSEPASATYSLVPAHRPVALSKRQEYAPFFRPLTWQPFSWSSPRPIFTRLRQQTQQRTLRTGVRKMRAKLSKGRPGLAYRLSGQGTWLRRIFLLTTQASTGSR